MHMCIYNGWRGGSTQLAQVAYLPHIEVVEGERNRTPGEGLGGDIPVKHDHIIKLRGAFSSVVDHHHKSTCE